MIFLTNSLTRDRCNAGPIFKHQNMKKIYDILYKRFIPKLKADLLMRPTLGGVFHKKGCLYATDGYVAVKVAGDYPEEFEGLLIDKKGEKIGSNFPNVDNILPNWTDTDLIDLDLKQLEKACKNVQRVNIKDRSGTKYAAIKLDEGLYFQAHYIASIFDLFKALGEDFQLRRYVTRYGVGGQLLAISENYLFDDVYATALMQGIVPPSNPEEFEEAKTDRPFFTIEEALAYEKEVKPDNKAWYE